MRPLNVLFLLAFVSSAGDPLVDIAPERLAAYIQVDTTNPPGNEIRGVEFLGAILKQAGIPFEMAESAPGRGNLWARLQGNGKPGLVLLHHIDVVPADASYWSVDPYAGVTKDGYVYGRGALDMKALGIMQLQAFLALHAAGNQLSRDVLYIATADEEAGGFFGAGWLLENHPEIAKGVGYVLNEGGGGRQLGTDTVFFVEVTQKVPVWLRLTARGRPGHGSVPLPQTAITRILRAGQRLADTGFDARVIEPVANLFRGVARFQRPELKSAFEEIGAHITDAAFMQTLQITAPGYHALLRNTCSPTTLRGSDKINVVPPEAVLELDCRLVPDQDVDEFIAEVTTIVNDRDVSIERIMSFTPASSSMDTPLYRLIEAKTDEWFPGSTAIPGVSTGFTDSHFFRDLGIQSYGFSPTVLAENEGVGVHGNDERISLETLKKGTAFMIDLVQSFATD
ncbi:MAG: M20/M25/M40 family metallo-hydrolase [Pseudomonadota bacterium]|nr:M20/M25/M40 family metallo-hydrolase [Pseudomonadota bacterium]